MAMLLLAVPPVWTPRPAAARQAAAEQDTTTVFTLDEVVVTAARAETPLGVSAAAVSRVGAQELDRLPMATIADALRLVPGFALVDFDGLGLDPQPMVRGFYGGGEAEYVVVMLNGVPLNDPASGLMTWDLVPSIVVDAVEVLRGGASSLYGDAAMGGTVNLITVSDADRRGRWELAVGQHRTLRGGFSDEAMVAGRPLRLFGGGLRTEGFRDHALRTGGTAGVAIDLVSSRSRRLSLSGLWMRRDSDVPGPVPASALPEGRERIEPFYRFDGKDEWVVRGGLDGRIALGADAALTGGLEVDVRRSNEARTLPLTPQSADTKERLLGTERLSGTVQVEWADVVLPWDNRVIFGVDASTGRIDSEYYEILSGDRDAYAIALISLFGRDVRDSLDVSGTGARHAAAAFAQYEVTPLPALRISLGARFDWLRDTFEADQPAAGAPGAADHSAFSPRAGVNLRWLESPRQTGHVYASVGRSFKAPTPDQLFDQRSVSLPFPPFEATASNPSLRPQHGTSVEVGTYHGVLLAPGSVAAGLSAALYQMDVEDELDFDLATLRYVNIGKSRHRGIETGVKLHGLPAAGTLFLNYTLQEATARVGPDSGRHLKAIPRHHVSAGLAGSPLPYLDAGIFVTRAGGAWLDDANTMRMPAFTRVDVSTSVAVGDVRVVLGARNVFNRLYSSTGFLDPSGSGTAYFYPAAGRTLQIGLSTGAR